MSNRGVTEMYEFEVTKSSLVGIAGGIMESLNQESSRENCPLIVNGCMGYCKDKCDEPSYCYKNGGQN